MYMLAEYEGVQGDIFFPEDNKWMEAIQFVIDKGNVYHMPKEGLK